MWTVVIWSQYLASKKVKSGHDSATFWTPTPVIPLHPLIFSSFKQLPPGVRVPKHLSVSREQHLTSRTSRNKQFEKMDLMPLSVKFMQYSTCKVVRLVCNFLKWASRARSLKSRQPPSSNTCKDWQHSPAAITPASPTWGQSSSTRLRRVAEHACTMLFTPESPTCPHLVRSRTCREEHPCKTKSWLLKASPNRPRPLNNG